MIVAKPDAARKHVSVVLSNWLVYPCAPPILVLVGIPLRQAVDATGIVFRRCVFLGLRRDPSIHSFPTTYRVQINDSYHMSNVRKIYRPVTALLLISKSIFAPEFTDRARCSPCTSIVFYAKCN